jgi:hypothetical protein
VLLKPFEKELTALQQQHKTTMVIMDHLGVNHTEAEILSWESH